MAAQTFREEKTNNRNMSLSFHLILMSTLTWITGKELEQEINNNGDQFGWKKNMKLIIHAGDDKMRNASGYQGENEWQ